MIETKKAKSKSKVKSKVCPFCKAQVMVAVKLKKKFGYGVGKTQVFVTKTLPYLRCKKCAAEIETQDTGRLAEDAGRRAQGMMVGGDFLDFRKNVLGLSIRDMSLVTGVGSASFMRWEKGKLRPNRSMDLLMRILRDFPETAVYARKLANLNTPAPKTNTKRLP